jgi:2-methylcitrate dehydratase PrpD
VTAEPLAQFAHQLRYKKIPEPVCVRTEDLMLDTIGIASASTQLPGIHN